MANSSAVAYGYDNPYMTSGLSPVAGSPPAGGLATAITTPDPAKPWHPDSPLFWIGGVIAFAVGFAAISTSVKVGPFKASASAGGSGGDS